MAADALEQSVLESKDREQLVAIASALGVKSTSRAKKADLIQKILEQTGALPVAGSTLAAAAQASLELDSVAVPASASSRSSNRASAPRPAPAAPTTTRTAARTAPSSAPGQRLGADGEPLADWEIELLEQGISTDTQPVAASATPRPPTPRPANARPVPAGRDTGSDPHADNDADPHSDNDNDGGVNDGGDNDGDESDGQDGDGESRNRRRRRRRNKNRTDSTVDGGETTRVDPDRPEPAARDNGTGTPRDANQRDGTQRDNGNQRDANQRDANQRDANQRDANQRDNGNQRNRSERFDRDDTTSGLEPVPVAGYLDLRDEGYGFLRVSGYLPSRDDSYIPVKLTRQFGLRKGDHITGVSRPAARNEKNPALLEVHTVNGAEPDKARDRPRFDELTPLFPDARLQLETPGSSSPDNTAARIIDLISPIGLGQRGIIVSPPKAGKTSILKTIATAIEQNHPQVNLMVLLIDERPEEVTEMRRAVKGEVIASTFDRPAEEHTNLAEMVIEKAKRLVEQGEDVVVVVDGITRLSRAYHLVAPATGRNLPGGIDAGALYPSKRFFGAARNVEGGGSLTILATAQVGSNSRTDDAIFEEFSGAANMELRLDRHLAEQRIYPAIDIGASSTQHEASMFTPAELEQVWKLRRALLDPAGDSAAAVVRLTDRLKAFRTNDDLLADIRK